MNLFDEFTLAMILALVGFVLVVAEVFFPSGGILGFFSALAMIAAVYFAYVKGGFSLGLYFAAAEMVLIPVFVFGAFQALPYTPMGKVLLGAAPTAEEVDPDDSRQQLVGRIGTARSKLLPAGAVEIDGQVLDCVSQSQAIDPGEYVRVVEVSANRVVVRRASSAERPNEPKTGDLLNQSVEELGIEDFDLGNSDRDNPSLG